MMNGVGDTREHLDSLGLTNVQIWSTENGTWAYQPTNESSQTQEEQARSLVMRVVYNTGQGLDKYFWNNLMEWSEFSGSPGSIFNSMGLIGDGLRNSEPSTNLNVPRASYHAYRLLAAAIDSDRARYTGPSSVPPATHLHAYRFEGLSVTNAARHVLWRDSGTGNVTLAIGPRQARVTNLITDPAGALREQYTTHADVNGNVSISVGLDPLLVQELPDTPEIGWWATRGVLATNATPNDYAAANQGQLKWLATAAYREMQDRLPGGAGSAITNLVAHFSASNNYHAVNLGQLKATALPFYDRLGLAYPWTRAPATNDFAAANTGQLKNLFRFTIQP